MTEPTSVNPPMAQGAADGSLAGGQPPRPICRAGGNTGAAPVQAREHGHPSASPQMTSEGTAVQRGRGTHVALVVYPGCSLLELIGAQTIWATASMMSSSA
jgi:hypothetical protein